MTKHWQMALFIGILGNALEIAAAAVIFREPPGSAIRPMDVPLYLLAIAFGTALVGIPSVYQSFDEVKNQWLLALLTILQLLPVITGFLAFTFFVNAFGYTLKP